jgi:hypothetical protein
MLHCGRPWDYRNERSMVRTTISATDADGLGEVRPPVLQLSTSVRDRWPLGPRHVTGAIFYKRDRRHMSRSRSGVGMSGLPTRNRR